MAQLTIETMDAHLEDTEIEETEYVLQSRIQNAEDELSKMKGWVLATAFIAAPANRIDPASPT